MRITVIAALAFAASGCSPSEAGLTGTPSSTLRHEEQIRTLEEAQAAAWNAHDIRAYAALFTEDAQIINVLGWRWRSRAELEQKLGRGFSWVFAESALSIDQVYVRLVSSNTAVATVTWSLTGARSPTGAPTDVPQRGIQTQVLRRQDDQWLIAYFQNTNSLPERDMPLGPQSP